MAGSLKQQTQYIDGIPKKKREYIRYVCAAKLEKKYKHKLSEFYIIVAEPALHALPSLFVPDSEPSATLAFSNTVCLNAV